MTKHQETAQALTAHKAVIVRGRPMWRAVEVGPRGGRKFWYAERRAGDISPTGWELWAERIGDVGGYAAPADVYGRSL